MKFRPVWIFQSKKDQIVGIEGDSGFGHHKPDDEFFGDRIPAVFQCPESFFPILTWNTGENVSGCFFAVGRGREKNEQ